MAFDCGFQQVWGPALSKRAPGADLGGRELGRNRFRVDSPKTGERWVPVFPKLQPHLEAAFEQAPAGTVHVIRRYRTSNVNLRTQFERIIRRTGLTPWPKLFHNLRASCQTELAERFPIHCVCYWLGNSAIIARQHYLQVRESDFATVLGCEHLNRDVKSDVAATEIEENGSEQM